jgi:CheY-like chemotaxis protein
MDSDLKNARILIVDDQIANVEVLEELLLFKGYENVKTTTDSREAMDLIHSFKPDLLLLDLMMPYVSGFDIMDQLAAQGLLNGSMHVLILTADATMEAKKRALMQGASDFLTKPYTLVEVELRIKNLLYNTYLMSQLQNQNEVLDQKVKERTAELTRINTAIQQQNDVLKDIAWTQSHVVRAPLARILGVITLLENDSVDEADRKEAIRIISDSAKELDQIVIDITDKTYVSKIFENKS